MWSSIIRSAQVVQHRHADQAVCFSGEDRTLAAAGRAYRGGTQEVLGYDAAKLAALKAAGAFSVPPKKTA